MSEFFVGYLPVAPGIARFLRKVVAGLGVLVAAIALLLVHGQGPFANAAFEFGNVREFAGMIVTEPYPTLSVVRPGQTGQQDAYSRYLLVAAGKHGADSMVAGLDGKQVRLRGQLIYRLGGTMVEVEPGSIVVADQKAPVPNRVHEDLGMVTIAGEIVDSKCYLGVMNPGQGKVHRDCAARCLSGGIPPLFIASDGGAQFLLVGPDGRALRYDELREFVAEPITLTGRLTRRGDQVLLMMDPAQLRHTASSLQAGDAHRSFRRTALKTFQLAATSRRPENLSRTRIGCPQHPALHSLQARDAPSRAFFVRF
jgi:hypothetical protein